MILQWATEKIYMISSVYKKCYFRLPPPYNLGNVGGDECCIIWVFSINKIKWSNLVSILATILFKELKKKEDPSF